MDEIEATVPGHVTAFFSPHTEPDDPTEVGATGAGLTLTDAVDVTVGPADERTVYLNGTSIEMGAIDRVLDALSRAAREETAVEVAARTDLPVGAGFGVSGAMALGTALAANRVLDCRLSTNELVTIAHGAEVQAGTGLGDVVAQAHGGVPIRLEPGAPQHAVLDSIPRLVRVAYLTLGELSTAETIGGDTDVIEAVGERALSAVVSEPTLPTMMRASRRFARETGLLTDRVREVIEDVSAAGGDAGMAMLGETVFALGHGLSEAGYDPETCRVDPAGAVPE